MCIFINYRILYKTLIVHCMPYTIPCHESTIGNGFGFFHYFFSWFGWGWELYFICNDFFFCFRFQFLFLKPEDLRYMLRCSFKLNLLYTPDHGLLVENKKIINFVLISFFILSCKEQYRSFVLCVEVKVKARVRPTWDFFWFFELL